MSGTRLIDVIRPIQPTTNGVRRDAEEAPQRRAVAVVGDALVEVDPEPDDAELLGRRNAELDEVVADLRADRDSRVVTVASARSSRRKISVRSGSK